MGLAVHYFIRWRRTFHGIKPVRMMPFKIEAMCTPRMRPASELLITVVPPLTTMADTLVRTGGEATIETISTTGVHIRQRSERVPWWNSLHA